MASPTRFPSGLNTYPPRHLLSSFPISTSPRQIALAEDFLPYRASDYTITQTNGTAAQFGFPSGAIKLSTTGATAGDRIYLQRLGNFVQAVNGNQFWLNFRLAYPRSVQNANDTTIYAGVFDTSDPSIAANGIFFIKPASATSVNFVIKKAGVSTTFQNVGDLALPSGLFNDTNAVNALLSTTVAGNAFTNISVSNPGAGYQIAPLILSTATSGSAGLVPAFATLGSNAYSSSNPQVPVMTTGLPYASIVSPVLVNPNAASFTNGGPVTTYLEVEPILDLGFWFDGVGTLKVGINGREVMAIRGTATQLGVVPVTAGATVNVATQASPSFYVTNQLTTALSPFQPPAGSPINIMPLIPLAPSFGFGNNSANARSLYFFEYYAGVELN